MNSNVSSIVWFIVALLTLGVAGLASAALVYLDLRRRSISSGERILWLLLALLLPGLGLGAYFFMRLLNNFLAPNQVQEPLWHTQFKRPEPVDGEAVGRGYTIPAADLLRPAPVQAAPGGDPTLRLMAIAGPEQGKAYSLKRLPLLIGRGSEALIALDGDPSISRRHAEVYQANGELRIRDLGSSHGTMVNGFSIQDKGLDPGDRIEIGRTTLQVQPESER